MPRIWVDGLKYGRSRDQPWPQKSGMLIRCREMPAAARKGILGFDVVPALMLEYCPKGQQVCMF